MISRHRKPRAVMDEIMNGQATPAQIGGFLTALAHERGDPG